MVPAVSHPTWQELIQGDRPIASPHFGFNLMLTNYRIFYRGEPSQTNLAVLTGHLHDYMAKYESLYQEELKLIFGAEYKGLFDH